MPKGITAIPILLAIKFQIATRNDGLQKRRSRGKNAGNAPQVAIVGQRGTLNVRRPRVRKRFLFLGFISLVMGSFAGSACTSTTPPDDRLDLPGRTPGTDASSDDGAVAPKCTDLAAKVSDRPACDKCAKEKCCSQIQACNESEDCKGLQDCLAPCAQEDLVCILTCQDAHGTGATKLQEVGSCATNKCKAECPSETPDADIFDAG
jgi:hypothetical protein